MFQGLCLINGTQLISSLGAEALVRAEAISRQADVIAALTLEALKGTNKAFDVGKTFTIFYRYSYIVVIPTSTIVYNSFQYMLNILKQM